MKALAEHDFTCCERRADLLAWRRAARFTNHQQSPSGLLEPFGEMQNLLGFAASFRTFEGDEESERTATSPKPRP